VSPSKVGAELWCLINKSRRWAVAEKPRDVTLRKP